ncbi:MAG: trypsin-like peptidase domain-containing protein [Saprospiraceae bacterium]|nr:trypsin-like peptidase domain-containing protein [Saprospiraceae bacterium]
MEKKVGDEFVSHGTGFLLYNYNGGSTHMLVTCEHLLRNKDIYIVIKGNRELLTTMSKANIKYLEVDKTTWYLDSNLLRSKVELIDNKSYFKHPNLDLAVIPISYVGGLKAAVESQDTVLDLSKAKGIPRSRIKLKHDVEIGLDIFFLGFPFTIGTKSGLVISSNFGSVPTGKFKAEVSNPLLRSGIVSWVSTEESEFLIDAFSYSGNSGSPVFTHKINGQGPFLVGMVTGHLNEEMEFNLDKENNFSISKRIGNMGLATCIWVDDILQLVDFANSKN